MKGFEEDYGKRLSAIQEYHNLSPELRGGYTWITDSDQDNRNSQSK